MYLRLGTLHSTADFMVGEIGSAPHANKAAWHRELYTSRRFPRLTQVAFFHERKEFDWRLTTDDATLAVNRGYLTTHPNTASVLSECPVPFNDSAHTRLLEQLLHALVRQLTTVAERVVTGLT